MPLTTPNQNRFEAFQSRGPWPLFVETLRLMRRHAGSLLSTVGLFAAPVLFISSLAFGWFFEPFSEMGTGDELRDALTEAAGRPAYFVVILTALFAQFMLLASVSVWVLLLVETDEAPDAASLWDRLIREFGLLAVTALGVLVLFLALSSLLLWPTVGLLLFIPAVLYYAVTLSPLGMVRLWDRSGLMRALFRCRQLVRYGFLSTLGLLVLTTLAYLIGVAVFGMMLTVVVTALPPSGPWKDLAGALFSMLGSLLFSIVVMAANLNYYNLVTRERTAMAKRNAQTGLDNEQVESVG